MTIIHTSNASWLDGEWERRVFIGISYGQEEALTLICQAVRETCLTPIVAKYYSSLPIEPVDFHRDALYKLSNCKYAIFDVTNPAGQLMELERTRDYETLTLIVYKKGIVPSRMIQHLARKMGNWGTALGGAEPCMWYCDSIELRNIILGIFERFRR